MINRKLLLGTTALAGAALFSMPAAAGTVGSGDNLSVMLSGEYTFLIGLSDQDLSAGRGRGYSFKQDDVEIYLDATNTADNGVMYGVSIELLANTDDALASDEAWAFVDSDVWGRVEMGDQDDAMDRMYVEADDVLVGRAGFDGDITDFIATGTGRGIAATGPDATGDATKITYFSPRFAGFQLGASLTPDTGSNGLSATETDNDGDFENVVSLGANWEGSFGDVGMILSATGEFGDGETASGAAAEDLERYAIGANVTFGAFAFGTGYADLGEGGLTTAQTTSGMDSGEYWNVGASYTTGPWGFSLGYFTSSVGNAAGAGGDTEFDIVTFDSVYTVSPGWDMSLGVYFVDGENVNATAANVDQDATLVLIGNTFTF